MRATKAGRVLGAALENIKVEEFGFCPDDPEGVTTKRCGQVMVFVNLVDYGGMSLSMLMNEKKELTLLDGLLVGVNSVVENEGEEFAQLPPCDTSIGEIFGIVSTSTATTTEEGEVHASATSSAPCVLPDNTNASTTTENSATTTPPAIDHEQEILSFLRDYQVAQANSTFGSELFTDRVTAALEMYSPRIIAEGLRVNTISSLNNEIIFSSDTLFFGRPYFTTDTAGFALIKKGEKKIIVTFEREYLEKPIVNATLSFDGEIEDEQDAEAFFAEDLRFAVANASTTSFTILLNKPAPHDISFNWTALAVKGAKTTQTETATTTEESTIESVTENELQITPEEVTEETPLQETEENTVDSTITPTETVEETPVEVLPEPASQEESIEEPPAPLSEPSITEQTPTETPVEVAPPSEPPAETT
jgi:hypothetical protein